MFSSITNKYYTSPKHLLASYLCKSLLAEFFDVDPAKVQTNLLRDAKVVLHQIEIKRHCIGGCLVVSGSVDRIEFSWSWDTQSLITDVTLTVQGVQIHVDVVAEEEYEDAAAVDENTNDSTDSSSPNDTPGTNAIDEDAGANPNWKARYLQQIIDHLTLVVTDVKVSISFNKKECEVLVLQAKGTELKTLSKADDKSLLQAITVTSVEAWIDHPSSSTVTYPILDPFGYHATVQRVTGRRFLDGILSGLFIQGCAPTHSPGCDGEEQTAAAAVQSPSIIRVHAGVEQIRGLSCLQEVLLSVASSQEGPPQVNKFPTKESPDNANVTDSLPPEGPIASKNAVLNSIFCLPIQAMELVLGNNNSGQTSLRLAECAIQYCTDGTQFSVECKGGIWMDDTPLSKNSRWTLDLATSQLVLDALEQSNDNAEEEFFDARSSSSTTEEVLPTDHHPNQKQQFRLDITMEMFQKLYGGIKTVLPQCTEAVALAEKAVVNQVTSSSMDAPWTATVNGSVAFRFSGNDDSYLEVAAEFPKIIQGEGASIPFRFACQSISVDSGVVSIAIPQIVTTLDGALTTKDQITIKTGSMDDLMRIQMLYNQVMEVIGGPSSSMDLPMDIHVPRINVSVTEPGPSTMRLNNIRASGSVWHLDQVHGYGFGGVEFRASVLEAMMGSTKNTLNVQEVQTLSLGDFNYLAKPLCDTRVVFENHSLSILCKAMEIEIPENLETKNEGKPESLPTSASPIMLPVQLVVDRLRANSGQKHADFKKLNISVKPCTQNKDLSNLTFACETMEVKTESEMSLSFTGVQASTKFDCQDETSADTLDQSIVVPGLGRLFSGTGSIREVPNASIAGVGRLARPILGTNVTFDEGKITIKCDTIHFECRYMIAANSKNTELSSTTITALEIPLTIQCCVKRLMLMPDFGPGKPGICLDELRTDFDSDEIQNTTRICVTAKYLQGRGPDQSDFSASVIRLDVVSVMNEVGALQTRLQIQAHEISKLHIPGVLLLDRPLSNPMARLQDEWLGLTCSSAHVSFLGGPDGKDPGASTQISLPFPIRLKVKHLGIQYTPPSEATEALVQCEQCCIEMVPSTDKSALSLRLQCAQLCVAYCDTINGTMDGLSVSTRWRDFLAKEPDSDSVQATPISVPGLGILTFASVEIGSISEMIIKDYGYMTEPILKTRAAYHKSTLSLNLDTVDITSSLETGKTEGACKEVDQFSYVPGLPCLLEINCLKVQSVIGGIHSYNTRMENLRVEFRPQNPSIFQNSLLFHSDTVIFRDTKENEVVTKSASLQTFFVCSRSELDQRDEPTPLVVPGIGFVGKSSLKLDEVSKFNLSGVGYLVRPVLNSTITYKDKLLSLSLDSVYLAAENATSPPRAEVQGESGRQLPDTAMPLSSLPCQISIKRVALTTGLKVSAPDICLESCEIDIKPPVREGQRRVEITCGTLRTMGNKTDVVVEANGLTANAAIGFGKTSLPDFSFGLQDYGAIFEATVNISSVSNFNIPGIGGLGSELSDSTLILNHDGLLLKLTYLEWKTSYFHGKSPPTLNETKKVVIPRIHMHLDLQALNVEEENNGLLSCGGVSFSVEPDPFDDSFRVSGSCIDVQGECVGAASFVGKEVDLKGLFTPPGPSDSLEMMKFFVPGIGRLPSATLRIREVSRFCIQGLVSSATPIEGMMLRFDGETVFLDCPVLTLAREQVNPLRTEKRNTRAPALDLPCNLKIAIQSFSLKETPIPGNVSSRLKCRAVDLALVPVLARVGAIRKGPGAGVYLKFEDFENVEGSTVIRVPNVSASGLLQFNETDRLGNLVVGLDSAELIADFSSVSWSTPPSASPREALKLPFAVVQEFDLVLRFDGAVVNIKDAKIKCESFEGDALTTLDTLSNHYAAIAQRRIPYLLTKTDFIGGANVADSVGMMAGSVAMRSTVIGSTVGVAARDAVGASLTKGKEARGATSTDKYKFGDFTRGVVESVKGAASTGSRMRGSEIYAVGDFSAGAAKAAGEYTSQNRVRLAGAGGSALGMVAGAAIAGPIGFVVGSFAGSSVAQSSMKAVGGDPNPKSGETLQKRVSRNSSAVGGTHISQNLSTSTDNSTRTSRDYNQSFPTNDDLLNEVSQAELIGDVASTNHRAVMVQAQILEQPPSNCLRPVCGQSSPAYPQHTLEAVTDDAGVAGVRRPAFPSTEMNYQAPNQDQYSIDADLLLNAYNPHREQSQAQVVANRPPSSPNYHTPHNRQYRTNTNHLLNSCHPPRGPVQAQTSPNSPPTDTADLTSRHHGESSSGLQSHINRHYNVDGSTFQPVVRHAVPGNRPQFIASSAQEASGASSSSAAAAPQRVAGTRQVCSDSEQGYRFGDITRGIVSRGKQKDGRDPNSGYKFGDFTRGLFK